MISEYENNLLLEKIKKYNNIIIAKHELPDWDAQGSALGLAYLIKQNFPEKNICVPGERLDDNSDFLFNWNKEYVNSALMIVVDTAIVNRIDFIYSKNVKEIIKFDHHLSDDDYGDINIVDSTAVACAQMVIMWAKSINFNFNSQAGENLYKGLMTDSGRLLFPKVNAESYQAAAIVWNTGFDFEKTNDYLYVSTLKQHKWLNYAFSKIKVTEQGVGYIILEPKDYENWKLTYQEIKSALKTMSGIKEIKVWTLIIVLEKQIKCSLRSRFYDVNSVAVTWNGGGHKLASGAKLQNLNEFHEFISDLDNLIIKTDKGVLNV